MTHERILVTGAAGFAGNAFLRLLLERRPEVQTMTLDALTYAGHRINLEDLPGTERHRFFEGDVADPAAVAEAFDAFGPDAVVHFAAETHVDRSILAPLPFVRTNVLGTQVLLEAARKAGIRLVQVSTDEVYGDVAGGDAAGVEHALRPRNAYAATKAAGDLLARAAHATHGQDVVVTRSTNNYGPRQTPEKLIPLMVLRARAGLTLPVYGDGRQVRDWLHVSDHAAGVLAALERGRPGAVYHFAGRHPRANLDVVRALVAAVGADPALVRHVADRPGHDRCYALDDASTRDELGWRPQVPFDDGLRRTADWYARNAAWCHATAGAGLEAFLDANYAHRTGAPVSDP